MCDQCSFVSLRINNFKKRIITCLATFELRDLTFLLVVLLKIRALCYVTMYRLVDRY
jgi:hypothetical protein